MVGRIKDVIWANFDQIFKSGRKGVRARCTFCEIEMEGQVIRMKNHLVNCVLTSVLMYYG